MSSPNILCISLTPALDRYVTVNNFEFGKVSRTTHVDERAGGKNINAARALIQIGGKPLVISTLGGHSGDAIIDGAREEGIELLSIRTASVTRQFTVIWDERQKILTQISERWNEVTSKEWQSFIDLIKKQIQSDKIFDVAVISGRMPPGVNVNEVTILVDSIMDANIPCFVDSAGEALSPLLQAKPTVVKVNNIEAGDYFGKPIKTIDAAAEACERMVAQGIEFCIITMGVNGAVGATKSGSYHVDVDSKGLWAVGSGDSFLGAMAVKRSQGESWLNTMIAGAAAGIANAHRQVAGLLDMDQFERGIKEIKPTRLT
jgi:1-phosphofructokinase family hexose kinase